jgi:hypothetical protein
MDAKAGKGVVAKCQNEFYADEIRVKYKSCRGGGKNESVNYPSFSAFVLGFKFNTGSGTCPNCRAMPSGPSVVAF